MDAIEAFDWDAANVGHILRHSVSPFEVEDVVDRPHLIFPAKTVQDEKRWKLFGKTDRAVTWLLYLPFGGSCSGRLQPTR